MQHISTGICAQHRASVLTVSFDPACFLHHALCPALCWTPVCQVLQVAQSNHEKLHEVVDTLTNHCIMVRQAKMEIT